MPLAKYGTVGPSMCTEHSEHIRLHLEYLIVIIGSLDKRLIIGDGGFEELIVHAVEVV